MTSMASIISINEKSNGMHKYLTYDGYLVKKSVLTQKEITMIRKDLLVTPKTFQMNLFKKPESFKVYKESENYFFLPRFYAFEKFGQSLKDSLPNGVSMNENVIFCGKLLDRQLEATAKTLQSLKTCGGGLLSLPCGFGKTCIAIYLALQLGVRCGILVNKEYLADQWEESINKFTEYKAKVGRIQQSTFNIENKDFVICLVQTLCVRTYNKEDMKTFGMFIADECHHLGSEVFSETLPKINCKYVLGLSATPFRKDGLTNVINYYLGPLCHSEKRKENMGVHVKQIKLDSNSEEYKVLYLKNGNKNTTGMINKLTSSKNRNSVIIKIIELLFINEPLRKILILSGIRAHLDELYRLLQESDFQIKDVDENIRPLTFGFYRGNQGASKKDHKEMLKNSTTCDVLLGTHHIASEGLDIPTLNTLIYGTPMSEVEQSCGRILRKEHVICPLIIDIIDNFGNFVKQSYKRSTLYKSEKYCVRALNINLDSFDKDTENINKLCKLFDFSNDGNDGLNGLNGLNENDENDGLNENNDEECIQNTECVCDF